MKKFRFRNMKTGEVTDFFSKETVVSLLTYLELQEGTTIDVSEDTIIRNVTGIEILGLMMMSTGDLSLDCL